MHQVKRGVDVLQPHHVGDHRVDLDLAGHIHIDNLGHISAALGPAKRGAAPVAPGDKLERAGGDFLTRFGHPDDDRGAPAAVAGFQRGAHHFGIAGRIKGVIRAAVGHFDDLGDGFLAAQPFGVEEVGHAEFPAPFLARRVDIHPDDLVRTRQPRALNDVKSDAAQPEYRDIIADLHFGSVGDCAHAGRHPAADIAGRLKRRIFADFGDRDFGQHSEIAEGGTAHIMIDGRAFIAEPGGAVGHQPCSLRRADRGAQVGLAAEAAFALAAFGRVERDHVIAGLYAGDARADFAHDPCAFVAEHAGEDALGIQPIQRIGVGMANARRHDFHQHFAGLRAFEVKLDDFEWLFGGEGNGGAGFHGFGLLCGHLFPPPHRLASVSFFEARLRDRRGNDGTPNRSTCRVSDARCG